MSATQEMITSLQALVQQLQQSGTAAMAAADRADQARGMAQSLGHANSVAAFGAIRHAIGEVQQTINSLTNRTHEIVAQAKALSSG